jgi:hypothetical protein
MSLLEGAQSWREFVKTYGQPEEVTKDEAKALNPNNVWTLWSRSNDYLINEFAEGDEVIGYWKTPKTWDCQASTLFVTMTIWIDCPTCEEMLTDDPDWDQDDCSECEGAGTLAIELEDCIDAKTEEEVFSKRRS